MYMYTITKCNEKNSCFHKRKNRLVRESRNEVCFVSQDQDICVFQKGRKREEVERFYTKNVFFHFNRLNSIIFEFCIMAKVTFKNT